MGLEWTLELTTLDLFSCIKMLRWPFAYSAMRSDNPHLNWCSWFTIRNLLVSRVGDLILRWFLDFLFVCFFVLFLLRCSSLLLELDEQESREETNLILLLLLRERLSEDTDFFLLCLRSSELCHLISAQIFSSLKFGSSVLFTCE